MLGERTPYDSEALKGVLFKDGRQQGYISGPSLFNRLGLTSQMPYVVTIATNGTPRDIIIGKVKMRLVRAAAPIEYNNVVLPQYLDVIKSIARIQDADLDMTGRIMCQKLQALDAKQLKRIQRLAASYYPPRVRAILGMFLATFGVSADKALREAINPATIFKLGFSDNLWPEKNNWQIR